MARSGRTLAGFFCFTLAFGWCAATAQAVSMDWVWVGDPGNACDSHYEYCFGAVDYDYQISKYETTNAQYAEFLNAVAVTDTYDLYNTSMDLGAFPTLHGGIARSGSSGGYTYSAIAGRDEMPVDYVSFYDSLRFANWLDNGQPTGAQDSTTTEDGAYTITTQGIADNSITRNPGATIFLTSEDEWHKAAYYNAEFTSYFDYPAGSDAQSTCAMPGATSNTANCNGEVGDLSDVGSYTASASPYGTFDQGGNVEEWNETVVVVSNRGLRGGTFDDAAKYLAAGWSSGIPTNEKSNVGFRVASIPEPTQALLYASALATLALLRRRTA